VSAGDSNGDRGSDGQPRFRPGRTNTAAVALLAAEIQSEHTWLRPRTEGDYFTRYTISKETIDNRSGYEQAEATSSVDHLSAGANAMRLGLVADYSLNTDMHLGANHVGLDFTLRICPNSQAHLNKATTAASRTRLEADQKTVDRYTAHTRGPLLQLLADSRKVPRKGTDLLHHMDEFSEEMVRILLEASDRAQGRPLAGRKRKKARSKNRNHTAPIGPKPTTYRTPKAPNVTGWHR
jgi:hypothetical protein